MTTQENSYMIKKWKVIFNKNKNYSFNPTLGVNSYKKFCTLTTEYVYSSVTKNLG